MICEACGSEMRVGDWPYCPHGQGSYRNIPDDVPGGFVVENAWTEPRTFYSQSEYVKALAADGMQLNPHHVPGGKLASWATMDAYTLANATELVSRSNTVKGNEEWAVCETAKFEVRVLDSVLRVKAEI